MTYHATSFGNITGADIARLPGAYKCRARACHLLIAQFFSSLTLSLSSFLSTLCRSRFRFLLYPSVIVRVFPIVYFVSSKMSSPKFFGWCALFLVLFGLSASNVSCDQGDGFPEAKEPVIGEDQVLNFNDAGLFVHGNSEQLPEANPAAGHLRSLLSQDMESNLAYSPGPVAGSAQDSATTEAAKTEGTTAAPTTAAATTSTTTTTTPAPTTSTTTTVSTTTKAAETTTTTAATTTTAKPTETTTVPSTTTASTTPATTTTVAATTTEAPKPETTTSAKVVSTTTVPSTTEVTTAEASAKKGARSEDANKIADDDKTEDVMPSDQPSSNATAVATNTTQSANSTVSANTNGSVSLGKSIVLLLLLQVSLIAISGFGLL